MRSPEANRFAEILTAKIDALSVIAINAKVQSAEMPLQGEVVSQCLAEIAELKSAIKVLSEFSKITGHFHLLELKSIP